MPEASLLHRAERIGAALDDAFPAPAIPLDHRDPFTLLVAVLLSAQCTDKRVNLITPALFARAATPQAMALLPESAILEIIRPCGLGPQKAKAIRALSLHLLTRHGGEVPADLDALTALPGVGGKTAAVVLNQAFGVPTFPVDTHIKRLAKRWGLSSATSPDAISADLKGLFPREAWGLRHLQMILFGRTYCPARGHDPSQCPICAWAAPAPNPDAP